MDEPAQCCCIDYAVAANVVRCYQLYVRRAQVTAKILNVWCGEEQECTWRTDIEQIFQPNLTEEFYVCTYGTLVDVGKSRQKKMCRDQNCVGATGEFWPKVTTFGCRGDMSPTCRRLSQPSGWVYFLVFHGFLTRFDD